MSEQKIPKPAKKPTKQSRADANAMIASKLKSYYDEIIEEGTPGHFLDMLEKLDAAERAAKAKTSGN